MATAVVVMVLICVGGVTVASPLLGPERCAEGPTFWCQNVKTASDCGAVKHCQQTVWRQPTVKSVPCDLCTEVVSVMGNLLKDNATEEELKSYLEKACDLLPNPTLTSQCNELVDEYLPVILDILKGELENPEVVCSALHLCQSLQASLAKKDILSNEIPEVDMSELTSPFIANVPLLLYPQQATEPKSNDAVCLDCTQFITDLQISVKENALVLDKLISQLKQQCNLGPGLTELCEKYIVQQAPRVAEILTHTGAKEICTTNGFCQRPATVPMQLLQKAIVKPIQKNPVSTATSQGCIICEFALREIEKYLLKNSTEETIVNIVEKVCSLLPATVQDECNDFVEQYGKAVVTLLAQELNPAIVCTLIGVCSNTQHVVIEDIKPKQLKTGPLCEICKTVITYLDNILEKNSTEQEIEDALDKVCNLLPATMVDECTNLIAEYGSVLLHILLESLDPNFVCTKAGLCGAAKQHLLGADKCVWGPSYWCKNMETATQCNAVEHCKRHIWN
ncbi:prosaposin [Chiloscyllium plagiosum]|uniref:prosaposin n=1 Tax=Chiloscyllium plagiosum TaxID=36176 RepID=UPI001CB7C3F3|nr:prosaposin [Chiloscyllium plagiosum]